MMRKLKKYNLEFKESLEYFRSTLSSVNCVSEAILKSVDFKNGSFFVLFPKNINEKKMHDFKAGGVLHQNPIRQIHVLGKQMKGQIIPTIQIEISHLIYDVINSSKSTSCLIDDYNSTPKEFDKDELFDYCGIFINAEVYYYFSKINRSIKYIEKSLERSNTFWHSLCILTEASLDDINDKKLSSEKIQELCEKASLIFVGAYDGEGYVFWEKN